MKGGTLHLLGEKLARQYGDIVMCRTIIGNLCFLNSARLVRQVFTDKGTELVTNDRPPTFSGAEVAYNYKDVAFGDGVKSSNWLKTRKLFHSTLKFYGSGVEKLERTMHSELSRLSEDLEELIKMSGEDGCQPLGESCDLKIENFLSTQGPDSKVPELIGDYALCIQKVASPTTDSLVYNFPFLRFLPGTYYKQLCDKTLKCRNALMEQVFTKGKANHVPGQPKGMLGVLFEEQMNNSRDWLTDDHIRALILDIVGGGYVTSTELLKSFFLYLTHNPQVMKRIQEEVDSVMGPRLPSFDDRKAMPFTEAAILEGLRVVSVLPLGLPHLTREDVSTGGFYLPKGTMLLENVWWMNRDPTAWEDPEVFRPDRFLDDEGQLLPATHPTRMRFLPFGVGRRSCSGENFARSRAFLYVTTLLQQFDFLPPVNHDLLPLTQDSWTDGIVLQLKPYHVAIKKRWENEDRMSSQDLHRHAWNADYNQSILSRTFRDSARAGLTREAVNDYTSPTLSRRDVNILRQLPCGKGQTRVHTRHRERLDIIVCYPDQDYWFQGLKMTWLLVLAGLFVYLLHKVFSPRQREVPPGPNGVGLFCDVFKAMKGGTLHLLGEKLARQYGDIVMCRTIIGNLCFLNSARLVRQVFTDKGTELVTNDRPSTFTGAAVAYNFKDVIFGDGIKSSDWSKKRRILHSTLKVHGIISLRQVTGETQEHESKVPQLIEDLAVCLQKITNPVTDFLIHTYPFFRFLPGSYYKELCGRTLMNRDAFEREVFTKGKAKHIPGEPKGMMGSLLEEQLSNSSSWLTDDHIRALLLDIIGAGYVTSVELLKTFFLYMAHYPQVMKRIQREIDSVVGLKEPCFDDRKKLPFTEAAILEVLRAASAIPLGVAHETREDVTIGDFCIPRWTMLFENMWWMNRDPTAWEEPNVFRPERFLDDEGQLLPPTHPTRMRFLPFGVGRRSCPGENFARSRAFLYVTTLLQQFDFLPPVNHDLLPLTQDSWSDGIVLQLRPYHVAIKERSQ
ncbi:hypothetical protein C0Q70_03510 [Pomacea canaliculata]|uniref:Uncharacterized protein n=1 Tax=Pomacea canaliculata TaxID=400727 RepID=A0A2T7PSY3_POMCA|nr:hypothetical protein C0Q70_03510 [Pomacea canaliculata]